MLKLKKTLITLAFMAFTLAIFVPTSKAKGNEYDAVCNHLITKYQGEKVKVRFMWLARAVVGIVKPAGVKSFKVTIFRNLNFSRDLLHSEMKAVMSDSFSEEWSPVLRMRTRDGDQVYMNMRKAGKNVKILLVKIDRDEAFVVRAKFSPARLSNFIEDPKILGVLLNGSLTRRSGPRISTHRDKIKADRNKRIIFEDDGDEEDSKEKTTNQ